MLVNKLTGSSFRSFSKKPYFYFILVSQKLLHIGQRGHLPRDSRHEASPGEQTHNIKQSQNFCFELF